MKIAVTGAAGFIGSCLVWKLNQEGLSDIIAVDILDTSEKWKNLIGKQFDDYIDKDDFLQRIIHGDFDSHIDCILHMGACSSTTETDARYLMKNNYAYSKALAEWAVRKKKRFIYASSAATYGDGVQGYSDEDTATPQLRPLNMYGYSKHVFDLWVLKNHLQKQFVGCKFFNVFGPNEYHKGDMRSMVHKGYEQIKHHGKIRLFKSHVPEYPDGGQMRDFVYIKDVLEYLWFFIQHPHKTGIFNMGTGRAHSWNDLAYGLFKALKIKPHIEYFDMPEVLKSKYQYYTQADNAKLQAQGVVSHWSNLEQAIQDYVNILETTYYL